MVEARKVRVPISHPRFDLRYAPYLVELDLSCYQDGDVLARTVELAINGWDLRGSHIKWEVYGVSEAGTL